ncbi:MAG: hypothetical protein ACTSPV_18660, partial [Candidatus Hodarchaeales archaeon]
QVQILSLYFFSKFSILRLRKHLHQSLSEKRSLIKNNTSSQYANKYRAKKGYYCWTRNIRVKTDPHMK